MSNSVIKDPLVSKLDRIWKALNLVDPSGRARGQALRGAGEMLACAFVRAGAVVILAIVVLIVFMIRHCGG